MARTERPCGASPSPSINLRTGPLATTGDPATQSLAMGLYLSMRIGYARDTVSNVCSTAPPPLYGSDSKSQRDRQLGGPLRPKRPDHVHRIRHAAEGGHPQQHEPTNHLPIAAC